MKLTTSLSLFAGASLRGSLVGLAGVSAVAMLYFVRSPLDMGLGYRKRRRDDPHSFLDATGLRAVARAHALDTRLWYLAPLTLSFGFSSALFTDWIDAVVDDERGNFAVAAVSAIITLVAGRAEGCDGLHL